MPIKILLRSTYRKLTEAAQERERLRAELDAYERQLAERARERDAVAEELRKAREAAEAQARQFEERVQHAVDERIAEMNISRRRFEQLAEDRAELIELYIERLYALACRFSHQSVEDQQNRGLFILLIDRRNMNPHNFSDFHDGQREYLDHEEFQGVERLPHVFSPLAQNILEYMGGKDLRLSKDGDIVGYEERDGAILVDLRGVIFKTRQMVEGVRTHKVYSKVERLMQGSARHNAAIYASALDEVLVAIVVSEETAVVTVFRDGRFYEAYDPHEDHIVTREEYVGESGGTPRLAQDLARRRTDEILRDSSDAVAE